MLIGLSAAKWPNSLQWLIRAKPAHKEIRKTKDSLSYETFISNSSLDKKYP